MRYDKHGFIVFNNSTDSEDSPVAAALAILFTDMPVDVDLYFDNYIYRRCANAKYTVSRDQALALFAIINLKYKGNDALKDLVDTSRVNGHDVFIVNGAHIAACKGLKPSWCQVLLLKKSIEQSVSKDPMAEQNQMIIQLMLQPDKSLLKWYCDLNPKWNEAVAKWLIDRDESDLARLMIKVIYQQTKGA